MCIELRHRRSCLMSESPAAPTHLRTQTHTAALRQPTWSPVSLFTGKQSTACLLQNILAHYANKAVTTVTSWV